MGWVNREALLLTAIAERFTIFDLRSFDSSLVLSASDCLSCAAALRLVYAPTNGAPRRATLGGCWSAGVNECLLKLAFSGGQWLVAG